MRPATDPTSATRQGDSTIGAATTARLAVVDPLDEAAAEAAAEARDRAAAFELEEAGVEPPDEPSPWLVDEIAGAPIDPMRHRDGRSSLSVNDIDAALGVERLPDAAPIEVPVDGTNGQKSEPSFEARRLAAIAAGAADPLLDPRARKTFRDALPASDSDQPTGPGRTEPDGTGMPRTFTIADARLRLQESIEHLPVLGVDGYIVKGWTHLLAGWWRLGKTEFLAAVAAPWMRRGLRVLWITEEPDSLWADRADMFDEIYEPVPWERLDLVDAMSAPPAALLDYAVASNADVVIADTIREVCGIASMKDDDAVRGAVSPWLRRLRNGRRTLIFIAQHRKAAGERGERVEGSVALPSMLDVILELEAVEGYDRRRRLTVRRRRSQTAPLLYEMDDDDRIVVIPDPRSRSRVETEAAAFAVVDTSTEPLTSVEVRRRMTPAPSRDTLRRALTALAEAGRIRRDPPLDEVAGRRTVRWSSTAANQLDLAQNSTSHTWEFAAPDAIAPDAGTFDAFTEGSA